MKLKTSKTIAKRIVRVTGSGLAMRRAMSAQHLSPGKSRRTHQRTKLKLVVNASDAKRLQRLLPYAGIVRSRTTK